MIITNIGSWKPRTMKQDKKRASFYNVCQHINIRFTNILLHNIFRQRCNQTTVRAIMNMHRLAPFTDPAMSSWRWQSLWGWLRGPVGSWLGTVVACEVSLNEKPTLIWRKLRDFLNSLFELHLLFETWQENWKSIILKFFKPLRPREPCGSPSKILYYFVISMGWQWADFDLLHWNLMELIKECCHVTVCPELI